MAENLSAILASMLKMCVLLHISDFDAFIALLHCPPPPLLFFRHLAPLFGGRGKGSNPLPLFFVLNNKLPNFFKITNLKKIAKVESQKFK